MVSLALKKTLNQHNICKGFKVIGIRPFNIAVMVDKLHFYEAFVEVEAFDAKFDKVDLHVKEVPCELIYSWGECLPLLCRFQCFITM
jgi:hypothetical protein